MPTDEWEAYRTLDDEPDDPDSTEGDDDDPDDKAAQLDWE